MLVVVILMMIMVMNSYVGELKGGKSDYNQDVNSGCDGDFGDHTKS